MVTIMNEDILEQLSNMVRDDVYHADNSCIEVLYSSQDEPFLDSQEEAAWDE